MSWFRRQPDCNAAKMRVDASDCVVVDSAVGVAAAVAAGMEVIGFAGGN